MKSKFNAVFDTFMVEALALPGSSLPTVRKSNLPAIKQSNNKSDNSTDSTTVSTISADNLPVSANTTTTSSISGAPDTTQGFNNVSQAIKNAVKVAMNISPEILKNLKAQSKFWTGQAGNGVDLLINTLEDYNSKKRLNALYGVLDYMKCSKPIIHTIPPCEFLTNIENKLNQINEKQ